MESNNSLPVGSILKETSYSYRIERTLGQGSFGITYLASVKMAGALGVIDANIKVAIKEFFMCDINGRSDATVTSGSKGGIYDEYKRKFTREALNLSKLQHPNIIKVIESFEANNTIYYVMEYVGGGSLDDYIAKNNSLKEDEAIRIIKQIGTALSFMHDNKMLHLDLKPSNIMMKESGDVVLIDFGLSKQYDASGEPESSTKVGAGTPGYAPIEQANYREGKGFPVTMDVYALGATMFKMLTGVRPPEASDILNDGFPLYELQEHHVSERISASIAKAMAPTKKDRYESVKAFLESFEQEVTVIDVDVVTDRGSQRVKKAENVFNVRPNTRRVTFEFHPRTPMIHGSYNCSVDKIQGVNPNITKEWTSVHPILSTNDYRDFLNQLQSLNLQVRDKEIPPYGKYEYSESPAKLTITLYDENNKVYNSLWISGWNNELGNIEGNIYEIEEKIREIVPGLQEYIDSPDYEAPYAVVTKQISEENDADVSSNEISNNIEAEKSKSWLKFSLVLLSLTCAIVSYYWYSHSATGKNNLDNIVPIETQHVDTVHELESPERSNNGKVIPNNFVLIPAGETKSKIYLDSFYLDKYELTQGEYKRIMGRLERNNYYYDITNELVNNGKPGRKEFVGDSLPVIGSYSQFVAYCQKRSESEGYDGFYDIDDKNIKLRKSGNGYRLVTAYEWQYAAKGGLEREKFKYIGGNKLGSVAWFGGNSGMRPHNVGQKQPNSIGLYDMAGNISEMFQDRASDFRYCTYGNYHSWVGFNDEVIGGLFDDDTHQGGTRIVFIPRNIKNSNTEHRFSWD